MNRKLLAVILILTGVAGMSVFFFYQPIINIDRASAISKNYLASMNNPDLAIAEIMEFEQNFYVIYYEESTGIGAFEMLIDKITGRIFPEYGPNMMWNTKYGHSGMMGSRNQPYSYPMIITDENAKTRAQEFLDLQYPGAIAEDPHPFYGYYTLHVEKDGAIFGMLSVNGFDGEVWYHNWHGSYIQSMEIHQD
jgi:hypothetical protein